MFFKDIIGQDILKEQLTESARKGIIPHARLFCGAEGTGAFQLAFAYTRYLNCTHRSETDACGKCPSCVKYNALAHPDLHFIFPMVQNKTKKKEVCDDYMSEWRDFIRKQTSGHTYFNLDMWLSRIDSENKQALIYSAESDRIIHKMNLRIYEAEYRILFIWMPERMHTTCANKLLKLIEEPYANTAIVMVTENPGMVLNTIVSRSQSIFVRSIEQNILTAALVEKWDVEESEASQITHISGGNYLKACEQLTVENNRAYFLEQFKTLMRNGWSRNVTAMKRFAEEMASSGRDRQKRFLEFCQHQIRENFIKRLDEPQLNYFSKEEADFAEKFHTFVNERNIFDLMNEFSLAGRHIAQNVNSKMVFFDLSMRIIVVIKK
ncbi:MAG: DNA polymerase III subunit delta [Tannerella sp.]|jgi:DNA polymerase-3 subunit delta'|nr:DNA polymerase III subunit delta [Tannerella sp.]